MKDGHGSEMPACADNIETSRAVKGTFHQEGITMPFGQEQLYFEQFNFNIRSVAGQTQSRLAGTIDSKPQKGETEYFDEIDKLDLERKTSRAAKTPVGLAKYFRRASTLKDWDRGVIIGDRSDAIRVMQDPTSAVTRELARARNRARDANIISVLLDTAYRKNEARNQLEAIDIPNTNIVTGDGTLASAAGGGAATGFTLSKFIKLLTILGQSDDDAIAGRTPKMTLIMCRQAHDDLLEAVNQVSSTDFSDVKALVDGHIRHFLGFDILLTELLPVGDDGLRPVIAYTPNAAVETIGEGDFSRVSERSDLSYALQAYTLVSYGGTRLDEKLVAVAYNAA
jgi:hypothetical protein